MQNNSVRILISSSEPDLPTLGGKIMDLVTARGLSISAAAAMVHMSRQQLWRIIKGDVPNPGILAVQHIVRGLGWKMRDLFVDGDLVGGAVRDNEKEVG